MRRQRGTAKAAVQRLRQMIVQGRFPPGSVLPARAELTELLGTSRATTQLAVNRLVQEKYLQTKSRSGTFVAPSPPHMCRYGLVFPNRASAEVFRSLFAEALAVAATRIKLPERKSLRSLYANEAGLERYRSDYDEIVCSVVEHQVRGVIFVHPPMQFLGTPVLDEPDVARVILGTGGEGDPWPSVYPDLEAFYEETMGFFASRGCRRLAVVGFGVQSHEAERAAEAARRHALQTGIHWFQGAWPQDDSPSHLVQLLLRGRPDERPDALLISDDNLVAKAAEGLRRTGLCIGQDVRVVAHANFPLPATTDLPIVRVGFDAFELLRSCVQVVDDQIAGRPVPPLTLIRPIRVEAGKSPPYRARDPEPAHYPLVNAQ